MAGVLLPLLLLLPLLVLTGTAGTAHAINCTGVVCRNGGECNNDTASSPCICPLPYIPPNCIGAANYCSTLQPDTGINELPVCLNGGTCAMAYTDPYFSCSCPLGYTGIRCNVTSTATSTTTVSTTMTGKTGQTSPPGPSACRSADCLNGGVCNSASTAAGGPLCICRLPYIPPKCAVAVNFCATLQPEVGVTSLPVCLNGGTCKSTGSNDFFECTCSPAYTGKRCKIDTGGGLASSGLGLAMIIGFSSAIGVLAIGLAATLAVVLHDRCKKANTSDPWKAKRSVSRDVVDNTDLSMTRTRETRQSPRLSENPSSTSAEARTECPMEDVNSRPIVLAECRDYLRVESAHVYAQADRRDQVYEFVTNAENEV